VKPEVSKAFGARGNPKVDAFFRRRDEAKHRAAASMPRYPGDYTKLPKLKYNPAAGKVAGPGEVVWANVPYEDDHMVSKDRPVLIISWDAPWLLGLPLSSTDHDKDASHEASLKRFWVNIGTGPWDAKERQSFVRVDRIVRLDPKHVRRTGGLVEDAVFETVASSVRKHWQR